MEFLGIGPLELFFVLIIILLVFGPKDIARGARSLGQTLNRLYRSENYRLIQKVSQELRNLPERLAREANLEELQAAAKQTQQELRAAQKAAQPRPPDPPFRSWVEEQPNPNSIEPPPPAETSPDQPPKAAEPVPDPSDHKDDPAA